MSEEKIIYVPQFNEKLALVGWEEVPASSAPEQPLFFERKPKVPLGGTHRWDETKKEFVKIPEPKRWLPRFNAEGGLIGFVETTRDKVPLGALNFDHLPDNACDGRYRWDDNLKRFEPLPHVLVKIGDTATINKMIVSGIVGIVDRELLPPAVQDQIRFIETTSPETVRNLKTKYKALLGELGA